MPFTAEAKNGSDTWERVDITKFEAPKFDLKNYELRCADPDCHAKMFIRQGIDIAPHFYHAPGAAATNCLFTGTGESEDHRLGKLTIAQKLRGHRYYAGADINLEVIIDCAGVKRIVDVLVTSPDGSTEAHEIQLARTSIQECEVRTNDYIRAGIGGVIWWFGGSNANDSALRTWAERTCGACGVLGFTSEVVII